METYVAVLTGIPGLLTMVLIVIGCLWLTGCGQAGKEQETPDQGSAVTTNAVKGLSRSKIQQKLKKLSESPAPKHLKPGACCYDTATMLERIEYVCPQCGEKTLYTNEAPTLVAARRALNVLQERAGNAFSLDESEFCRKCRPDIKEPKLFLKIGYQDGRAHTAVVGGPNDMRLLNEFFSNKLVHDNNEGGEVPLKNYQERLDELLGANK